MFTRTDSAGNYISYTAVSAGSKKSQTFSAEARYDGQSRKESTDSFIPRDLSYLLSFINNYNLLDQFICFQEMFCLCREDVL